MVMVVMMVIEVVVKDGAAAHPNPENYFQRPTSMASRSPKEKRKRKEVKRREKNWKEDDKELERK